MSRWRRSFDRIGGPDAVTWPAFWVSYVLILAGNFSTGGAISTSVFSKIAIISVAQVAAFIPLVILRLTLLRNPPKPRPWVAVAGFLVAAAVRTVTLTGLLIATGATSEPLWIYRFTASLTNFVIPLVIIALVVSTMRAQTRAIEILIRVQDDLLKTETRIVDEVSQRNEEAVSRVQDRLRDELRLLDSMHEAASVSQLQRLATDVVRPMSHELAHTMPTPTTPTVVIHEAHISWEQAARQMIERPPLQPLLAGAFMGLLLIMAAFGVFGVARGIPLALSIFASIAVLSTLANKVLGWVTPQLGVRVAPAAVVTASILVGYASVAASSVFLPPSQSRLFFVLFGGMFPTIVIFLSAASTTVVREQRATEQKLSDSTEQLRRQLVRLRQAQWLQQQGLARALHGPVQAAVTSAALRLDAAVRAGTADASLLAETRTSLLATLDVLGTPESMDLSIDVAVTRIRSTWEGVCEITFNADDQLIKCLTDDHITTAVIVDLMSEAISNAVRHGGAQNAHISINCEPNTLITLIIRDDGRCEREASRRGMGTLLLEECTLDWHRDNTSVGCVLTIVLPVVAKAEIRSATQPA